jgi:hypothetical protein
MRQRISRAWENIQSDRNTIEFGDQPFAGVLQRGLNIKKITEDKSQATNRISPSRANNSWASPAENIEGIFRVQHTYYSWKAVHCFSKDRVPNSMNENQIRHVIQAWRMQNALAWSVIDLQEKK